MRYVFTVPIGYVTPYDMLSGREAEAMPHAITSWSKHVVGDNSAGSSSHRCLHTL